MAPFYPNTWNDWNNTTATAATATTIWVEWTANTTATANTATIWNDWCVTSSGPGIVVNHQPVELTPEQREAAERAKAERAKAEREAKRKREEAQARARELLVGLLTPKQRDEFDRDGWFHVETREGRRRYRLQPGRPPILVHGEDGRRLSFCIHPDGSYPAADVVLAQKLLLETDEDSFLRTANATVLAR